MDPPPFVAQVVQVNQTVILPDSPQRSRALSSPATLLQTTMPPPTTTARARASSLRKVLASTF